MTRFVFIVFLVFSLFSCSLKRNYNIGQIITTSDIFLSFGISARNGMELAVNDFNINEKKAHINIILFDDNRNTEQSVKFIKKASTNDNVFGIIGPLSSSVAKGVMETVNDYKIPTIIPLSNVDFLKKNDDYVFTMNSSIHTTANTTSELIIKDNKLNDNIVIIYNNSNSHYFNDYLEIIKKNLKSNNYNNVFIVSVENNSENNYSEVINKTMLLKPNAVLIIDGDINSAIIAQTIKIRNEEVKLYGTEFAITERIISNGGNSVNGMKFVTTLNFDPSTREVSEFITGYVRKYGLSPDATAFLTYNSTKAMLKAFKNAKYNQLNLKKELMFLKNETGNIFNEYGDLENQAVKLIINMGKISIYNDD